MILLILMINFIVIDVILTSILTSGIVAAFVFWLFYKRYNTTYKKRVDEIMSKINKQSNSFTKQVDGLNDNLKGIMKILEALQKKK